MPTLCPPSPKTACKRARKTVIQNGKNPIKLAEREGFEPSVPVTQYARLAIWCLRPLGHLSASKNVKERLFNIDSWRASRLHRMQGPRPSMMSGGLASGDTEAMNQWNRLSWFSESSTK
jgi:hypothetical protein